MKCTGTHLLIYILAYECSRILEGMSKILLLTLDFPSALRVLKFRGGINVVNRIFVGIRNALHVPAAYNIERWGCYDVESE